MSPEKMLRIGVMIGHIETPYARMLLQGMMTATGEMPVSLHVFPGMYERAYIGTMRKTDDTTENFMFSQIFDYATSQHLDRLIISLDTVRSYVGGEILSRIRKFAGSIPSLVLEAATEAPHLLVDSEAGMRACAEHLVVRHGFTRLGFISGTKGNYGAEKKLSAFLRVMDEHGVAVPEDRIVYGDYTLHSGIAATRRLLANCPNIEAICCANDWMAMGCCQELRSKGLEPGRDVAVTGFDDISEASRCDPPLTTVRTHISKFGYEAVKKAVALSPGDSGDTFLSLPPALLVRSSCGCGMSGAAMSCTSRKVARSRQNMPESEEAWTNLLLSMAAKDCGAHTDEALLRQSLGEVVKMVWQAFNDPAESLSISPFRQAFQRIAAADAYRDMLPASLRAIQYFFMSLMRNCSDDMSPKLIHFAQRAVNLTVHAYDSSTHDADDRQKKRLRFITSMARDVLQQEDKVDRLWHKVFYSVRNLKLGNIWIFSLDDPYPMNHQLFIGTPWEEMKLVGYHVEREIRIFEEKERPDTYCVPEDHLNGGARNIVYFPLFAAREIYGVMAVEASFENLPTLFAVAIQAGTALQYIFLERDQKRLIRILNDQSQQYERKATQDELTGLLNRFGFISRVDSSIAGHSSERAILAFADLDHLKHINDTLGHAAGDAAITTAADLLRQGFGPSAVIGRMGGDEFVVFSCLAPGEKPEDMLAKVRNLSAEYNAKSRKPYYVEISLGLTEFQCESSVNLSQLLKRADACLYEAKQTRRATSIRQNMLDTKETKRQ